MIASAPGKLVLLGDYAVLEGARAMVAAVDRRALGRLDPSGPSSEVVDAVLARAGRGRRVRIDTSGFLEPSGDKLGVGSSAAVAVVTAALATEHADAACFEHALEGHRDAAGGVGSGIDVAASFHGGVIVTGAQPAPVERLAPVCGGLHLAVLYANQSASTKRLVSACRASPSWPRWSSALGALSEAGIEAWAGGDEAGFLSVVAEYGQAMGQMGEEAGVAVVTPTIQALMDEAEAAGGAAKPSGAGGGDVVVAFSSDPQLGTRLAERTGARRVDLRIDPVGLRFDADG